MILSKSYSRGGGSTVLEGQTLQKSIRRATPNSNGKKKRQKSLPAPSPDALFRPRARFLSILGSRPDLKNHKKPPPKKCSQNFFAPGRVFCRFWGPGQVPKLSPNSFPQKGPQGMRFGTVFWRFSGPGREPKIDKKRARRRKSATGDGAGSDFCRFFSRTRREDFHSERQISRTQILRLDLIRRKKEILFG